MKAINKLTIVTIAAIAVAFSCSGSKVYDPAQDDKNKKDPVENVGPEPEPETNTNTENENSGDKVSAPPSTLTQWLDGKESPLDPFYKKYLDCDGLPILSSDKVRDTSLYQARYIVREMLKRIPKAREEMIKCHFRIGVVGYKENITDLPECKMMPIWWPDTDWDARGRGYGATEAIPVMSIGEENLVKVEVSGYTERYWSESIMVHEFAHNVDFALRRVDSNFKKAIEDAYKNAKSKGLWKGTYSMDNDAEYFAEGAQAWYNTCRMEVPRVNGSGKFKLKTRQQLKDYDQELYDVLASIFPEEYLHGYHFDFE